MSFGLLYTDVIDRVSTVIADVQIPNESVDVFCVQSRILSGSRMLNMRRDIIVVEMLGYSQSHYTETKAQTRLTYTFVRLLVMPLIIIMRMAYWYTNMVRIYFIPILKMFSII